MSKCNNNNNINNNNNSSSGSRGSTTINIDSSTFDNICLFKIDTTAIDANRESFDKLFTIASPQSPVNAITTSCKCESQYEIDRITCLVNAYKTLLQHRAKPMSIERYHKLLRTNELCNVQLLDIEVTTLTEELAETQILYTFIRQYIKKHPKFLEWGPPLSEIKIKSDFYSST